MANTSAPRGFKPLRRLDGAAWTGCINSYPIATGYATKIGEGDAVKLLTDGTIARAGVNEALIGVFLRVSYVDANGKFQVSNSWPASTTATQIEAIVIDDPNVVYEAELAGATAGARTQVGANIQLAAVSDAGADGVSTMAVDSATITTTATHVFRIVDFVHRPDNDEVAANAKVIVKINQHAFNNTTGV